MRQLYNYNLLLYIQSTTLGAKKRHTKLGAHLTATTAYSFYTLDHRSLYFTRFVLASLSSKLDALCRTDTAPERSSSVLPPVEVETSDASLSYSPDDENSCTCLVAAPTAVVSLLPPLSVPLIFVSTATAVGRTVFLACSSVCARAVRLNCSISRRY